MLLYLLVCSLQLAVFAEEWVEAFNGRIDKLYLTGEFDGDSLYQCLLKGCPDGSECFFSHHLTSRKCYRVNFSVLLIKWFPGKVITKDPTWNFAFTTRKHVHTKPKILWLLDNKNKGSNFGTAGENFKIGVKKVEWSKDALGPRAGSPLLYAQGRTRQHVYLRGGSKGHRFLDMLDRFTISMWIRTDLRSRHLKGAMLLLGSMPTGATRFNLSPSVNADQLQLTFSANVREAAFTTINNQGVNQWRHVSVVYKPDSVPVFYLNGTVWPLQHGVKGKIARKRPTFLTMWSSGGRQKDQYYGTIACVAIFQANLLPTEIQSVRDNCP